MTDWNSVIGNFESLRNQKFINILGKSFYLTILKHKETLFANSGNDENPFYMYETLQMALNPPKKGEKKPTYKGTREVVDKNTKQKVSKEDEDCPMKKFAIISVDVKVSLSFILNKFIKETYSYYMSSEGKSKKSFIVSSKSNSPSILEQIYEYSIKNIDNPITPVLINITKDSDIESVVSGNYANLQNEIISRLRDIFKTDEEQVPEKQLSMIIDVFISFLKIIAVYLSCFLYEKRTTINQVMLNSILRIFNVQLNKYEHHFDEETFNIMKEYIIYFNKQKKTSKTSKTSKKSKKDEDDEDEDDDDEDENENDDEDEDKENGKKKTSKKKTVKTTKTTKATKKKTTKKDSDNTIDLLEEVAEEDDEEDADVESSKAEDWSATALDEE